MEKELIFCANINNPKITKNIKTILQDINIRKDIIHATDGEFEKDQRECGISWVPIDNPISSFLESIIKKVNINENWNLDLSKWQCEIQYTYYYKTKDHYDWHIDVLNEEGEENVRKLSIIYCLTQRKSYSGAELEFMFEDGRTEKIKLSEGDFVVFSSNILHRVKKLTSGTREVLVGWYQ